MRHCRVLPSFPSQRLAGDERGRAQSSLADIPYFLLLRFIYVKLHGGGARSFQPRHCCSCLLLRFLDSTRTKLHHEPPLPFGKDGKIINLGHAFLFDVVDQKVIEALKSDGSVFKNLWHVIASFIDAGVSEDEKNSLGIAVDESHLRFQNGDAGALAPYQCSRNVEVSVFAGQKMIEVISRNSPGNGRILFLNQLAVSLPERR